METVAQYAARIQSYVEGKDPLEVQRQTPELLSQLLQGVPEEKLTSRSQPDKWSVAEVVAHLSEAELSASWRYRQMIEHDGGPLSAYDQDLWYKLGDYPARPARESLQLFLLLRKNNLDMMARLTTEEWQRHGLHAERGRMTVADLAQALAGHDLNHLEQIRKLVGK